MTNARLSFFLGLLTGLAISLALVLLHLVKFVTNDLDAYRRWLDKGGIA